MEKHSSNLNNNGSKVKLLCSYGGKIQSRPTDHQLSYVGGDTKILAVDRTVKFSEIIAKLNCLSKKDDGAGISVKYQLPGEDLDALVSLIDDEDVEHMMAEYDRMQTISTRPARLRIFVFDVSGRPSPPVKSGIKVQTPLTTPNPDYLFGFDKEYQPSIETPPLDLLQIPGIISPENYSRGFSESHVANWCSNVSVNGATAAATAGAQVVYQVPAVVSGGVYQSGAYAYGVALSNAMGSGNREQPVYSYVPIMPPVPEPRMMVSTGNSLEMKVNQRNF